MHAGLGSQGDDGEDAAGGEGLACKETPGGGAEPRKRRLGLIHAPSAMEEGRL